MLIFEDERYAVRKVFNETDDAAAGSENRPLVVTFPHAGGPTMNRGIAFGERFLKLKGVDAYHVLNAKVDWFQHPEFWDAINAIHLDAPAGRDVVTYGASMGGYGALLASTRLAATRVFAVVPQYSIERDIVPFEKRWKDHAATIGRFIHDIEAEIDPDCEIYSLHDPRNIDRKQMALFAPRPNWTMLTLPYSGHTPLMGLQQAKVLSGFVMDILEGNFDIDAWVPKLLRARRQSAAYWRVIATHAIRLNRVAFAEYAITQMHELGAHPKELEVTRAALDRNIQSARRRAARIAKAEHALTAQKLRQDQSRRDIATLSKEVNK